MSMQNKIFENILNKEAKTLYFTCSQEYVECSEHEVVYIMYNIKCSLYVMYNIKCRQMLWNWETKE